MDRILSGRALAEAHPWRPIPGCPGRVVLRGGASALDPGALLGGVPVGPELRVAGARDPVVVVPLTDGGLLSYRHADGTWTHTIGDADGFRRKLAQLGLDAP